jgi:hypothetical protein
MAERLRLAALAAVLFVLCYSGVTWALAGARLPAWSAVWFKSERPTPPAPALGNIPPPDRLRLAAYQAGAAYAQAPCDPAAKARLIAAVGAYAKAWHDMRQCAGGCDRDRLHAADAAFSTALDMQVRRQIAAAFDKRGVSVYDFPAPLRLSIARLAGGTGDPAASCTTHDTADR